ncbi:MAG: HEXXH motif-containing putative peptide modification protein, partial [Rhizonema sp. NSF051]|nr:HEXXH motif-containing putative peptide modification protein [Rhizonema sp. NSF051]
YLNRCKSTSSMPDKSYLNDLILTLNKGYLSTSLSIQPFVDEGWHSLVMKEQLNSLVKDGYAYPSFSSLRQEKFLLSKAACREALDTIRDTVPEIHDGIKTLISNIVIGKGRHIVAVTSPHFYGTVFASAPLLSNDKLYFIDHLVHEMSHLYLNTILAFDSLVINSTDRYPAPIRQDIRPLLGIYHATFVLSRIIYTLKKILTANIFEASEHLKSYILDLEKKILKGHKTISSYARMTENGQIIFSSMLKTASISTVDA